MTLKAMKTDKYMKAVDSDKEGKMSMDQPWAASILTEGERRT